MITNQSYVEQFITTDNGVAVPYSWTHGATRAHMGDGLLVYAIVQHMRARNCVCIGSGGGFIPRIMTQARVDLHKQGIFSGNPEYNWGDIGATYLVDACNGVGGPTSVDQEDSFYRKHFFPRFIKASSTDAYYDFFVRQDIKIDLLFIDGDHTYEGVKSDFDLYSKIMSERGVIMIHDTDSSYESSLIVSEDCKTTHHRFDGPSRFVAELRTNPDWRSVDLFNFGAVKDRPSTSGITIITRS